MEEIAKRREDRDLNVRALCWPEWKSSVSWTVIQSNRFE
jgi:hypothetical protein